MAKVQASDGHVYDKSSSANATEAPTNETTKAKALGAVKLSASELDFVTIVHYEWGLNAALPTKQDLIDKYFYKADEVEALYASDGVKAALNERGVELGTKHLTPVGLVADTNPFAKPQPKLTPIQLIVANTLLDLTDPRSEKKKLNDLNVTTKQFQSWLRDPDFSYYLRERSESLLNEDLQHEALLALADGVRSGNINHIKYYHAFIGRFVEPSASGNNSSSADLQFILIRIMEILSEEVEDAAVLQSIGSKLKALVAGGALAQMQSQSPVTVPEIAKSREQTPEVQKLMAKGLGYDN